MMKLILAFLVVIVLVGVVLAATGVISVQNTEDKTSINIDKQELKKQAGKAVDETKDVGKKMVEKAGQAVNKAKEAIRGSTEDRNSAAPSETPSPDRARQSDITTRSPKGGEHVLP